MSIQTQYAPDADLNAVLLAAGASKTVYALTSKAAEYAKASIFGGWGTPAREQYLDMFRETWTSKQDATHQAFFERWFEWSEPVIEIDPANWRFQYPTAGASEALRHLIYDLAARHAGDPRVHVFDGEYEGYRAMAEAAGLAVVIHERDRSNLEDVVRSILPGDLFFISQPSAIDGNVWHGFNEFVAAMPRDSVVADVTYVGSICRDALKDRFDLDAPSIRNVVFSLSKPFGVYYDRIGGMLAREEDAGMFGNKWFKNLTSLAIGSCLMGQHHVFDLPDHLKPLQEEAVRNVGRALELELDPSDVVLLATGKIGEDHPLAEYLTRAGRGRVCVTKSIAEMIDRHQTEG